jgi:hypothetical protein
MNDFLIRLSSRKFISVLVLVFLLLVDNLARLELDPQTRTLLTQIVFAYLVTEGTADAISRIKN